MSHGHDKKKHHDHDHERKKHHGHHGDDKGKLSAAMKNKGDDYDEMTPGYQPVTADSPKDLEGDLVAVLPQHDQFDAQMNKIIVNIGADQGVLEEMTAFLIMNDGSRRELNIIDVRPGATHCTADISEPVIQYQSAMRVIFNPSK